MKHTIHFLLLIVSCNPNIGCQQVPEIEFTLSNGNSQSAMLQKYCKLGNDDLLTLGKSGIYEGQVYGTRYSFHTLMGNGSLKDSLTNAQK